MITWAIVIFVFAIAAAVLGFSGIAGAAAHLAFLLGVIGVVLAFAMLVMSRRPLLRRPFSRRLF